MKRYCRIISKSLCNRIISKSLLSSLSSSSSSYKIKNDSYLSILPLDYEYINDNDRRLHHLYNVITNYNIANTNTTNNASNINTSNTTSNTTTSTTTTTTSKIDGDLLVDVFSYLMKRKGGIRFAMKLREDVLNTIHNIIHNNNNNNNNNKIIELNALKSLDDVLKQWLGNVFCEDALELRRVTFESSSGNILEKITKGEAAHTIRSLSELKLRLSDGRRCFAFFHNGIHNEPLAFIHVALINNLCGKLKNIYIAKEELHPSHAIFYSVNSPHPSLTGLDLASRLIRSVSEQLMNTYPTINTYSTLSPIPDFMKWLLKVSSQDNDKETFTFPKKFYKNVIDIARISQAKKELSINSSQQEVLYWLYNIIITNQHEYNKLLINETFSDNIRAPLMWLVAHYLLHEKIKNNYPRDPVARFHLRNGASLHNITWMGNPSITGLTKSAGMMVNYIYDMSLMDERAAMFEAENGRFHYSDNVKKLLEY